MNFTMLRIFVVLENELPMSLSEVIDLTRLVPQKTFNKQLQGTGESVFSLSTK